MASRVGAPINVTFGASFTVPSGANAFKASGIWYDGANQAVTAVSGSRITVDSVTAVPSSGAMGAYSVHGRVNSTGSDTWSITKAGFFSEGPTCQVQFYSVADNTNFIRQQQVVGDTSGAITRAVNSTGTDLVDACIMSDGGGTVSGAISGFTAVGTEQTTNADKSRMFQANSPGASSTSITGPANSYPALAIWSVYDSGGGGITGSLAATESGSDTAAVSGTVKVQGSLSSTESGSDTSAIAGSVRVSGSLAVTESGSDTAAIVGGSVATGSLNATETGSDTAAVSGTVPVQGSLAVSEAGSDTASASGTVLVSGSLAVTEAGADSSAISGVVLVQGSMSVTEDGPDTFAATGSLSGGVNGSLNVQEAGADTFAASGAVVVSGSLAVSESGPDSAAIPGVVVVSGAMAVSESGADQFAAVGTATSRTGSMAAVEDGPDTAQILGPSSEGSNLTRAAPGLTPKVWPGLWIRYEDKPKKRIERLEEEERERIEEIAEQAVIEAANERTKKAMKESLQASMRAAEIELAAVSYLRLVEQAAALRMEQIEEEDIAIVLALM